MWITLLITSGFLNKIRFKGRNMWILTQLFLLIQSLFNKFLLKKDINLLYLHQKWKLWIKYVKSSLSDNKNPQRV